jgi:hypothetical protein
MPTIAEWKDKLGKLGLVQEYKEVQTLLTLSVIGAFYYLTRQHVHNQIQIDADGCYCLYTLDRGSILSAHEELLPWQPRRVG